MTYIIAEVGGNHDGDLDQALSLIDEPLKDEKEILSNFNYRENLAVIHTDEEVMPNNKDVWSSWNSCLDNKNIKKNSLTYWLNILQNLKCEKNIFLTLNPFYEIPKSQIYKKVYFTHPYYDYDTLKYQNELISIISKQKSKLYESIISLKRKEDMWILRMGTFYGDTALNSRDEIKSDTRCNYH